MNKVILKGNLTRSPELKTLPSGVDVCNFGIAVSERYKDSSGEIKERTCFVDCASFGKRAAVIQKWVKTGDPILIEGKLNFESWEKDGAKRSKLGVIVENFDFLNRAPKKDESAPKATSGNGEVLDEELPF